MNMLARPVLDTVRQSGWPQIQLQRDGAPPLRFAGRSLARQRGGASGMTAWHDLALHGTATRQFIVEIVAWTGAFGDTAFRSRSHALPAATLEKALDILETHDPLGDLWPAIWTPAEAGEHRSRAAAQLSLEVAALHAACHDMILQYRSTVGLLLSSLAWTVI